jgi:acyl-CoA thioesterase I
MNDAAYAEPGEFLQNISGIVAAVRRAIPAVEFLLVTPMLPTPSCGWVVPARFESYRAGLVGAAGRGVAVADVTAVWQAMASRKDLRELTGNGLNHPNDFGHRVYADVVLAVLGGSIGVPPLGGCSEA